MATLLTLIHVSDLHVGPRRYVEGHDGYSKKALIDLGNLIHRGEFGDARLVFTGDLTAIGHSSEFEQGNLALERLRPKAQPGALSEYAVGGNHDRWNGEPPWFTWGANCERWLVDATHKSRTTFKPTPTWRESLLTAERHGVQLDVVAIDSDADVFRDDGFEPWLARLACGACAGQADVLGAGETSPTDGIEANLKAAPLDNSQPKDDAPRLLLVLIHHSPCYVDWLRPVWPMRGGGVGHLPPPYEITTASRRALGKFIACSGADTAILLSGHIHVPDFCALEQVEDLAPARGWELRCGTSTKAPRETLSQNAVRTAIEEQIAEHIKLLSSEQLERLVAPPLLWKATGDSQREIVDSCTCLVHRLCHSDGKWLWVVDLLVWNGKQFRPYGLPGWQPGDPVIAPEPQTTEEVLFPRAYPLERRN